MSLANMVEVLRPGNFLSVQSLGKRGDAFYGQSCGGVIDRLSANLANHILENPPNVCVLESFMLGPALLFNQSTKICLTGADMSWKKNGLAVPRNKPISFVPGDVLKGGPCQSENIGYIAIQGGWQQDSPYPLKARDHLRFNRVQIQNQIALNLELVPNQDGRISFIKGPEWDVLCETNKHWFSHTTLRKSNSFSRMAFIIKESLPKALVSVERFKSVPVFPGIIQATQDGKLIVLSKDCQVTGGYPRVAYLDQLNLAKFAQVPMTESFTFHHRYL